MRASLQSLSIAAVDDNPPIPRIALSVDNASVATGFSVRRIFYAIANGELRARKHGKCTIIELAELQRWVTSLPARGRAEKPVAS